MNKNKIYKIFHFIIKKKINNINLFKMRLIIFLIIIIIIFKVIINSN